MTEKCLVCELRKMFEALDAMHSFFSESMGEERLEEDHKASQLDVAFTNAEGSVLILKDLVHEFATGTGWEASCEADCANA